MNAKRENRNVVSVVSHGDGQLVVNLLRAVRSLCDYSTLRVIVTVNIPERLPLAPHRFPFPVVIVRNDVHKGYGANHNAAFKLMQGNLFSVLNPGICLTADPFVVLTERLGALKAGAVAPLILSPEGQIEDSVRRMITPLRIVKRVIVHGMSTGGFERYWRLESSAWMYPYFKKHGRLNLIQRLIVFDVISA